MTLFGCESDSSALLLCARVFPTHRLRSVVSRFASRASVAGAWGSALVAGLPTLTGGTTARAQDWSAVIVPEPSLSRREMWAGADVAARSWSAYSGATLAPFGSIASDGWRLRTVGGYGAYNYGGSRERSGKSGPHLIRGTVSFLDVLVGYHHQFGPLTLKVFTGFSAANHQLMPVDVDNSVWGLDHGFKSMLEAWLDMTERSWASLDLVWSSAHDAYASRLRFGFTIWPELSLGVEAGAAGSADYDHRRGGAFVRYTWESGEISAAGGPSLDGSMTAGAYGTFNALVRF